MRFVWLTAVKDLRLRLRDPYSLLLWLFFPLLLAGLMTLVFGRGGPAPRAHLFVADEDDSLLSSLLRGAFERGPLEQLFEVREAALDEGRELMDQGEGSALLVIPAGFGVAVLKDQPTTLRLVVNPSQRILPGIVEETLSILQEAVFYLQQLIGDPVNKIVEAAENDVAVSDDTVAEISVEFNRAFSSLSDYVDPPLIELETEAKEESEEPFNIGALFFPGALLMALLFNAQGVSMDVWRERTQGTLRRVARSPAPVAAFAAGKTLAFAAQAAAVTTLSLAASRWMLDLTIERPLLAVGWATLTAVVFYLFLMALQTLATSARTAGVLTSLILFPLVMVGGGFFPFEVMPPGLATIGRALPNGWALVIFRALLDGETTNLAQGTLGLTALAAALFLFDSWRLRRGFASAA